ncbi:MAG: TIGR01906 family membrane protein [Chloroflexi bacterium]|nr:TIGR01906 family membrane protein [Chloroflexota bacterium]MCY3583824.1 TIGR01906 family membrane protein [Chloroflexota bacterium]MCY3716244.1 TIGR01906 family membrane protein [Chloroflexota bacterium]MDE2650427.1 TIGR01906 family membrane protein [Chloroflexota bacterium]
MSSSRLVVKLLLGLALLCLLLMTAARLLLSYEFLRIEYQRPGFPPDSYGFSASDRLTYGRYAIDYLFNAESVAFLAELRLPRGLCFLPTADADDCALFNAAELRHMQDVKQLTQVAFALAAACALCIGLALWRDWRAGLEGLQLGAWLTVALIGGLGVVALAAWDSAFDRFHELFFAAGSWRFPYSDSLIRLYPQQLFVDAALFIAAFCAVGAGLTLLLCHWALSARAGI